MIDRCLETCQRDSKPKSRFHNNVKTAFLVISFYHYVSFTHYSI